MIRPSVWLACAAAFVLTLPPVRAASTPEDGDWSARTIVLPGTPEAALMVRTGDIDNLGFGWPDGFNPFTGLDTPAHDFPWTPDPADPAGTDRIMVPSSYVGTPPAGQDGYVSTTSRPDNLPQPIVLTYDLAGLQVDSALLQMFVDDFQAPVWQGRYEARLNGVRAPFLETAINALEQTGPIGKLISVQVPADFLDAVRSGSLTILIDDPATGAGDGYAIDFVKLLIDPTSVSSRGAVAGLVFSAQGGPVAGATVVTASGQSATTGANGYYEIADVPAGLVVLTASRDGYAPATLTVDLPAGMTAQVDFLGLRPQVDLSIAKEASPNPAIRGQELAYTITVVNASAVPATGVSVVDPVPAGAEFVSASATPGGTSLENSEVVFRLGDLAAGASATLRLVVRPTGIGTLSNTATVRGQEGDPAPANNTAAMSLEVVEPDTTPPTVSFTTPAAEQVVSTLAQLTGEAADAGRGLDRVLVAILRNRDSAYWDGSAWVSAPAYLPAALAGDLWSYGSGPGPGALEDGDYTLNAVAYDRALNNAVVGIVAHVRTVAPGATLLGPFGYLRFEDSPFASVPFYWFRLETFEDGQFNVPGVTSNVPQNNDLAHPSGVYGPLVFGMPTPDADSVDADDGAIDGSGSGGHSFFSVQPRIEFMFDAGALGGLPTHVGLAWTDGANPELFEAFDAEGRSLGRVGGAHADGRVDGATGEDRFYGVVYPGGVARVVMSGGPDAGLEVDHLQFGRLLPVTPEDGDWSAEHVTLADTVEADLVVRTGDIDNLNFGWPPGYSPFSGLETPVHPYPWAVDPTDAEGTDRIMVVSSYLGFPPAGLDGYTATTSRPDNAVRPVTLNYDLGGRTVTGALLQMFVDDFQAPVWQARYEARLNGARAPFLEAVINALDQTGPIGKLISLQVPPEFLDAVRSGSLTIQIDDPATGAGDGYAIDFVRLLINPRGVIHTGTVAGTVTVAGGGALADAEVTAAGGGSAHTDGEGHYRLEGVPAGLVFITAAKPGYGPATRSVDLVAGATATLDLQVVSQFDVAIGQTVAPNPVLAGGESTFTLTVTNLSAGPASDVTVTEPLPPELEFVSASPSPGGTSFVAGEVTFRAGRLAPGESATFTLVVRPAVFGTWTVRASASSLERDANPANNSASATLTVRGVQGGIFLTGHDPDYHAVGSLGAQHIIQRGIAYVTYGLPQPRLLLVTDLRNPGGDQVDSRLGMTAAGFTYDVADWGSGSEGALDLHTVNFLQYDAIVVASDYGGWLEQEELDILIGRSADLLDYLNAGGGLVAFSESGHRGPGAGTIDRHYQFLPFVVGAIPHNQGEGQFRILPAGEALGLTLQDVTENFSHAIFTETGGLTPLDLDGEGNIVSLAGRARPVTPGGVAKADLALTKTAPAGPIEAGSEVRYDLVVVNQGPDPATFVEVTDPLPAGVEFVSASSSQGTSAVADRTVAVSLGTLAPQAQATISIVTKAVQGGTWANSAWVSGNEPDPAPANNRAQATTLLKAGVLPTVTLLRPADGSFVEACGDVTLEASAEDSDGSVAKVEFFDGGAKVGEAASAPYVLPLGQAPPGVHVFTAVATDDRGNQATSAPATVGVRLPASAALAPVGFLAQGQFHVCFRGAPGLAYAIEASEDLQSWTQVGAGSSATGLFDFVDPDAPQHPYRFYRARPLVQLTAVYRQDFEGAVGPEWSSTTTEQTPLGARQFLGRFGNDTVELHLANLPPHQWLAVSFELYLIESWDADGSMGGGPDLWHFGLAGGLTLVHSAFSNTEPVNPTQTYPGGYPGVAYPARTGAVENNTLGYEFYGDSVYRMVFLVPHSADEVTFQFAGSGLGGGMGDENWGLDNVRVDVASP